MLYYNLFACWLISHAFADFKIIFFVKKSGILSVCQTVLDPDQARQSVGPELGPICLQRLSADDTSVNLCHAENFMHHSSPIFIPFTLSIPVVTQILNYEGHLESS